MNKIVLIPFVSFIALELHAQPAGNFISDTDSLTTPSAHSPVNFRQPYPEKINVRSFIVPAAFIAYGFVALESDDLKEMDKKIQDEIWVDHPHETVKIDNYLQYAPAAMVFGLQALGIKGKNNVRDEAFIYLLSNAMMGVTVQSLKAATRIQRPDGHGTNAFPSGHTATAFVSAEFLFQEYKNESIWYGIAGYSMATATAYLRMYNNKHWFRDLLPGAGIGMLSTKVAYLIYPAIKKRIFKGKPVTTMVAPYYEQKNMGLTLVRNF